MTLPRALLLAAASVLTAQSDAGPIQTNYGTGDGSIPGGAMPTSNLLATNLLSASRSGSGDAFFYNESWNYPVDLARLYDGQLGDAGPNPSYSVLPNVASITFALNLATRPNGYDVASIRTYASWDSGRDGQAYAVEYSTAADPTQFVLLATVSRFDNTNFPQITMPSDAEWYLSMYNRAIGMGDPMASMWLMMYQNELNSPPRSYSEESQSSTMVKLTDGSGTLASGVAALRFNFSGIENSGTAFREFVVEGVTVATPTTVTSLVTDLAGYNIGGVVTFEGGTFASTVASSLPASVVALGYAGTLNASGGNISGSSAVTISGTSLTLTGSTNSVITLSGAITGTGLLINAAGNNVISGTNTNGGISVTGGSLRISNLASLPASNNTVSSGGTIILPTNIAFSGAVTIAGSGGVGQAGALVLDGTGSSAAGLSGIAVNLSGNATVALRGNQDYTLSSAIAGTAPGKNLTLDIANRSLKLTGTTASSVSQVTKTGVGTLLIDTTGVVNSGTVVVSAGLLTNNGTINGGISVSSTGKLGGSGTINGSITVAGALAPGNSPGILTQATGNATLGPGGSFEAELGGTTAGNGNGFHDQFLVQSGSITLGSGVLLEVKNWLKADGVTTFTAARRDVFSILGASAGITGTFADLSNPGFTTWMLYDNQGSAHTLGKLYGTGLLGSQTFAAYATVPWQTGILTSIWNQSVTASASSTNANPAGFINSDTLAGKAAVIVLTSADLNRDLALMSPEAYLAVSDFGLTVGRDLLGQALDNVSLWKEGNWTVAAGYSRSQHDYLGGNDAVSNYRLQSNTSLASVRYQLAPTWQVGTFFGYTDGQTNGGAASSKVRGNTFGLLADGSTAVGGRDIGLRAAVSFGGFSYDMNRSGSKAADQKLRTVSAEIGASTDVYKSEKLSFGPEISLTYGRARTSVLNEVGGTLPLSVKASLSESLVSTAGLELTYQMTAEAVITVKAGWEHEFADAADVEANFSGGSGSGFYSAAAQSRNTAVGGLDLGIRLMGGFTLHLTGEVRDNRQFNRNVALGANLNRRF